MPSPLLHEGIIYFLKTNSGVLSAFDAKTGKPHYQIQRLEGVPNVFSSPVAAAGKIYIVGREGTTAVVKPGATFEMLRTNTLDDHFDASPALVDKEMYLRGAKYLYCIAQLTLAEMQLLALSGQLSLPVRTARELIADSWELSAVSLDLYSPPPTRDRAPSDADRVR